MYPLAHAGFAAAVAHLYERRVALPPRSVAFMTLGGLLPDLLDKPLGFWVLGLPEGRLIGHTVLFALAWLLAGRVAFRSWTAPVALVGWGCLMHLLLDAPLAATLLWPLLGPFPIREYALDVGGILEGLLRRPWSLVGEVAGAGVLAVLGWPKVRRRLAHRAPPA